MLIQQISKSGGRHLVLVCYGLLYLVFLAEYQLVILLRYITVTSQTPTLMVSILPWEAGLSHVGCTALTGNPL